VEARDACLGKPTFMRIKVAYTGSWIHALRSKPVINFAIGSN
jgi:hypothetical protein